MHSHFYAPHAALQPFIQGFIYSKVGVDGDEKLRELDLFPVGYSLMAFILKESHYLFNAGTNKNYNVRFNFTGQLDTYHHLITSSASMIYVLFKPYGAYRILGVPQFLLKNECLLVDEIMGKTTNDVFQKMEAQAEHPLMVIKILEGWLLEQMELNREIDPTRVAFVCDEIVKHAGKLSIHTLNRRCGMSKSSMEQHFKDHVGVSPKMFSRIIRFNELNTFLKSMKKCDWMEIVERYGYFDQSHFIKEFKEFFGYTPSQMHLSHQNLSDHISSVDLL